MIILPMEAYFIILTFIILAECCFYFKKSPHGY